jgi:hypothetical protein
MRPLTLDDLLPLSEYAGRRREFFEAQCRYLDRYRRVRVGPRLTLVFENRQTLWFRVQEVVRVARLSEPALVQRELALYNRLLPRGDCLQAALLIDIADETHLEEELDGWRDLHGAQIRLTAGPCQAPAELVTARPEDRCFGAAHWVCFKLEKDCRTCLADPRCSVRFQVERSNYRHESGLLSDEIRQSLLEDLQLSERRG